MQKFAAIFSTFQLFLKFFELFDINSQFQHSGNGIRPESNVDERLLNNWLAFVRQGRPERPNLCVIQMKQAFTFVGQEKGSGYKLMLLPL